MGIILNGVLGAVSGKIAGIVGARWKDKAYLRGYTKPANPNTAKQQIQRTKFSDCVNFAKPLVGQIFNVYVDLFQKSMSGFNYFIRRNIDIFDGSPSWSNIKLTEGPLSSVAATLAVYVTTTVTITYTESLGNNGLSTDSVFAVVYDKNTGIFYFAAVVVTRADESIAVTVPAGLDETDLSAWLITSQYVTGTLVSVSNSEFKAVTVP